MALRQTILLVSLALSARAFVTFSMLVPANRTACFKDFYPEKESIAVHFKIQDFSQGSLNPEAQTILAAHPLHTLISHRFFDARDKMIGEIQSVDLDVFTHTTIGRETIKVCATNGFALDTVVTYNITVNVLNNDHERLPDKDHLRLYEADLNRIEALTEQMSAENAQVLTRIRARQFSSNAIFDSTSQFAVYAILFILGLRGLQIWYLKAKLKSKKML
jgi:hypothetical protein